MYKDVLKRILALALCICVIAAGVRWTALNAAAEDDAQNMTEAGQDTEVSSENTQGLQGMQMNMLPGEETEETSDQTNQEVAQETEEPVNAVQEQKNRMLYGMDVFTYRVGVGTNIADTYVQFKDNTNEIYYDGTEKKPGIIIRNSTGELAGIQGEDYYVAYQNNVAAGTAKVIITGNGTSLIGGKELTFEIKPRSIANATIGKTAITEYQLPNQKYNGTETVPTLNLNDGDMVLVQGEDGDYTVEPSWGNLENGKGKKVTLTVTGKGNYSGSVMLSYYVEPKDINDEDVTVTCLKSVGYTGSRIEPPVDVY